MIAPSGLSAERVEQGMYYVMSLELLRAQVQTERGSTLDTRLQRNEALDALERWMYTFRLVARGALAAYPAYLKMLGLTSEARKTKKAPLMLPAKKVTVETSAMSAVPL